jgi:hypothetical protein
MSNLTEQQLETRRVALSLACQTAGESSGEHVLSIAKKYLDFLEGTQTNEQR